MGDSGERVRNTWVICLQVGDSFLKREIIPNVVILRMQGGLKAGILRGLSLDEEPASYQLVGEVTAHQGFDG